jgi:hypothetical protein
MNNILGDQKNAGFFQRKGNSSRYGTLGTTELINKTVTQLQQMRSAGKFFSHKNFNTPDTRERVKSIYFHDYEMISDLEIAAAY